jgi:dihydrolipoamide dehydrogenase
MPKKHLQFLLVAIVVGLVVTYWALDLHQVLTLDTLKTKRDSLQAYYSSHKATTLGLFFAVYVLVTALSMPGATLLTLAAGASFGFLPGFLIVSFASTLGATLAFLVSRFLLRDTVERHFGDRLRVIEDGIRREGSFYLFTLRLVPLFPFFIINLLMGLTPMRVLTFYLVSQAGMIPGTLVYVNAGTQLAQLNSVSEVLSPGLLLSFALLGIFPLLTKKTLEFLKTRRAISRWKRPRSFDYNLIVIGAGSGGLVSAYIAAAVKAKVLLIEKNEMGGDCLNTGCVPSKALIKSAKVLATAKRAKDFGFRSGQFDFSFSDVMERVQSVIKTIAPHDSIERYQSLGVECIHGTAHIISPFEVAAGGRRVTTRNIIVATGAEPIVPKIPGLEKVKYLTSESIWNLRIQPQKLLVLGAGPIGCELAQAFQRLGTEVTILDMASSILSREDDDVSRLMTEVLQHEGIRIVCGAKAREFEVDSKGKRLIAESAQGDITVDFDEVLLALGRSARTQGFGLEELGVQVQPRGTIEHDEFLRTNIPNIYCVGDVAGPYQFTHAASHQGWYAAVNSLFSPLKSFKADYRVMPRVTYTDPEIASVGLTEKDAREKGIPYELTSYHLNDFDRAIAETETQGFIKVLTAPGKDRILGATVVGAHAGESFIELVTAMKHGIGLNKILGTIHPYPSFSEANKYAAGQWKRAHAPQRILSLLEKFHGWRRS